MLKATKDTKSAKDIWANDSGASQHIRNKQCLMFNYWPLQGQTDVILGDGKLKHKVKRLRLDQALEFYGESVQSVIKPRGIAIDPSGAYAHEQNPKATDTRFNQKNFGSAPKAKIFKS